MSFLYLKTVVVNWHIWNKENETRYRQIRLFKENLIFTCFTCGQNVTIDFVCKYCLYVTTYKTELQVVE